MPDVEDECLAINDQGLQNMVNPQAVFIKTPSC